MFRRDGVSCWTCGVAQGEAFVLRHVGKGWICLRHLLALRERLREEQG